MVRTWGIGLFGSWCPNLKIEIETSRERGRQRERKRGKRKREREKGRAIENGLMINKYLQFFAFIISPFK